MVLSVCFSVNIHQVYKGEIKPNSSFYFAFITMFTIIVYLIVLFCYLLYKFKDLETEGVRKRVGDAYLNLAVSKNGRGVLFFWLLTFVRRLAIGYVVTFGQFSLVSQLFFINFSSIFMMALVGIFRPYKDEVENRFEIFNEFTYLIVYCHIVCQTEFVLDIAGRDVMGWSLIGVISVNILVNFGNVLVQDLMKLHYRIKFWCLKKAAIKKRQMMFEEKRLKAALYRMDRISEYRTE